jgi:hypothetical protein
MIVTLLVALAAAGGVFGMVLLRRGDKCRRLRSLATRAAQQGRRVEALRLLLAAESLWTFNRHHGSRSSMIAELEEFLGIIDQMNGLSLRLADNALLARTRSLVESLRNLLQDGRNFGKDGRKMTREAAEWWMRLCNQFDARREALRTGFVPVRAGAEADPNPPFASSRVHQSAG